MSPSHNSQDFVLDDLTKDAFLVPLAKSKQVSSAELDALQLALRSKKGKDIAAALGISEAAARKRMGEVYKKFNIQRKGPGKLADLKTYLQQAYDSQFESVVSAETKAPLETEVTKVSYFPHEQFEATGIADMLSDFRESQQPLPYIELYGDRSQPKTAFETRYHWKGAPTLSSLFSGRLDTLNALKEWIEKPATATKLLAICGIGGIGKTCLALKLIADLDGAFEHVVWIKIDLNRPPSLKALLWTIIDRLQSDSEQSDRVAWQSVDIKAKTHVIHQKRFRQTTAQRLIQKFIGLLTQQRCLIVLDGFESVFSSYQQSREQAGQRDESNEQRQRIPTFETTRRQHASMYQPGLEDYGSLITQLQEPKVSQRAADSKSCVILTSREKPREMLTLNESDPNVRLKTLNGLDNPEAETMLENFRLQGTDRDFSEFIERYYGHPLALRLAANAVQDLFYGQIRHFLDQEISVFDDLRSVLKTQFKRLSPQEKEVMYWLAINRVPCSLESLKDDILSENNRKNLVYTLQSLGRRSLVEGSQAHKGLFCLHPIVAEYVLDRFIRAVFMELVRGNFEIFNHHALMKADAADYLREFQRTEIVLPILNRLRNFYKSLTRVDDHLSDRLRTFRTNYPHRLGYAGGNFINLLVELSHRDLSQRDFSKMTIWQAYLQGTQLKGSKFNRCELNRSVFTETMGDVMAIAFNKQSTTASTSPYLAAGDTTGSIHLWNTQMEKQSSCQVSSKKCAEWVAHSGWVRGLAFVPKQPLLVTGGEDSRLTLWRLAHLQTQADVQVEQVWQIEEDSWSHAVAVSETGEVIASGGDNKITLYRTYTGEPIGHLYHHPNPAIKPTYPSDQAVTVSGPKSDLTAFAHHHRVRALAFSPDNKWLASCGDDYKIRLWQVQSLLTASHTPHLESLEPKRLAGHSGWVHSVAFSADGKWLVSGSEDKTLRVWEVGSGKCINTLQRPSDRIRAVAVSPDGQFLASGGDDSQVMLWHLPTQRRLQDISVKGSRVWSLSFQQQAGELLLAAGGDKQTVMLWLVSPEGANAVSDRNTCPTATKVKALRTYRGYTSGLRSIDFLRSDRIVGGGDSQELLVWDTQGEQRAALQMHHGRIWSVAVNGQGTLIASGSDDHTVRLWDGQTGQHRFTLKGHKSWVRAVAFSQRGSFLASGGDDSTIRIWNTASGFCLATIPHSQHWIRALKFNPKNSRYLISGGDDGIVRWWDRKEKISFSLARHQQRICAVDFSPNSRYIASGSDDASVIVWDTMGKEMAKSEAPSQIFHFTHSELGIKAVAFSPDSRYLAAGGDDQLVYIWDLESPNPSESLMVLSPSDYTGQASGIRSIAFSADSQFVITGGLDAVIRRGDLAGVDDQQRGFLNPITQRDRPYENIQIEHVKGLSDLQKASLLTLGATERPASVLL